MLNVIDTSVTAWIDCKFLHVAENENCFEKKYLNAQLLKYEYSRYGLCSGRFGMTSNLHLLLPISYTEGWHWPCYQHGTGLLYHVIVYLHDIKSYL